jgi:hypothetical protein
MISIGYTSQRMSFLISLKVRKLARVTLKFVVTYYCIQGVFEVEVFLLTCDSMRCSKEF